MFFPLDVFLLFFSLVALAVVLIPPWVRNLLFEQINSQRLDSLAETIAQEISVMFPKIAVQYIKISPDTDRNSIELVMSYQIKYTNIADTVSINFI